MRRAFVAFTRNCTSFYTGIVLISGILACSTVHRTLQAADIGSDTVATVRHAPSINGQIQGSVRQLTGESVILNGSAVITSALLVPGTPTLVINGHPNFGGTVVGSGSTQPTNYQVTLDGGTKLGNLVTRTDPLTIPTVNAPPNPTGTRDVTITQTGQSAGDFSTLRNLTLNSNVGAITVAPGTYGTFVASGGSSFVFGIANSAQPVVYNLKALTLNGGATLTIVGPVILTTASSVTLNGNAGIQTNPSWLALNISGGGLTVNGNGILYGNVLAPTGQVILNGNSIIQGSVTCDRLTVNGNGLIKGGGQGGNQAPTIATAAAAIQIRSVELPRR